MSIRLDCAHVATQEETDSDWATSEQAILDVLQRSGTGSAVNSVVCCSPEAWLSQANDRAAWECWGKAQPQGGCPAHPLLCHSIDVAAVAGQLLTSRLPRALRRELLSLVPGEPLASARLLLVLVALHDIGKFTPAFQAKVEWARRLLPAQGFDFDVRTSDRHHGDAGLVFGAPALEAVGLDGGSARRLARAVAAHHGEWPRDENLTRFEMSRRERGVQPRWHDARAGAVAELTSFFGVDRPPAVDVDHAYLVKLAGLTSVADWIGSMSEVFTYEPPQPSVAAYWPMAWSRAGDALDRVGMVAPVGVKARTFIDLFPGLSPWPLHDAAEGVATNLSVPSLVMLEAPMGEGKTEAALLIANAAAARLGQEGLYIALPTKATANQMFGRLKRFLERSRSDARSNLVLAHGDREMVGAFRSLLTTYDADRLDARGVRAEAWFLSKKRMLLAEHGVGTIDQALLGVMNTRHAFVRLYGLSGKTVVLDEVHAYDTFTGALLERLVEWLAATGTTVLLLSATLPSPKRQALADAYQRGCGLVPQPLPAAPYPRLSSVSKDGATSVHVPPRGRPLTVHLKRIDDDVLSIAEAIAQQARSSGCVGWICNTVSRAQAAAEALTSIAPDLPRIVLHARMLPDDRAAREEALERALGPEWPGVERPARLVVIGTQVLEQSLDVDFDLLVTDLAPVDLLLQRAGRLHRHRDRRNRAGNHSVAHLWVVHQQGRFDEVQLTQVARVYHEAVVRETLRALDGRATLNLPGDIEPLVEAVYGSGLPPPDDPLFDAYIDSKGREIAKRQNAQGRLLPSPRTEDDVFADVRLPFGDDDDPLVHDALRAITRDAELSVQVVCLVKRGDDVYASEVDSRPLCLSTPPQFDEAARLSRRTIGVSHRKLVPALLRDSAFAPEAWADHGLLRYRRALAFTDGVAHVEGLRLELHQELGLRIGSTDAGR